MSSPLPGPLRSEATDALPERGRVTTGEEAAAPEPARDAPAADRAVRNPRAVAGALKRRARAEAKRRFHSFARRTVTAGGLTGVEAEASAAHAEVRQLRDEINAVYEELRPLSVELRLGRREVRGTVDANRINIELLKGEVRSSERKLDELGMAFAPGAGLAGAAARFAELREAVNGLERRLRNLSSGARSSGEPESDEPGAPQADAPTSTLFNYVGFERRFRGDPEQILANLDSRYGELLLANQPIVDVGCGRAELLEMLASRGAEVVGVEPDPGMVAEGRARGVTVHEAYASDYLRSVGDHSLGSIFSAHVAEHLQLDVLIELLELSIRKLKPGGVFIAETPNPESLIVLGNSYILDPTHVWPLHPSLLTFLCESAGFRGVRLEFFSPAEGYHLAPVESASDPELAEGVNDALGRLNKVLFGPQEYAVIATTPPE